jgi:hypothetical protein
VAAVLAVVAVLGVAVVVLRDGGGDDQRVASRPAAATTTTQPSEVGNPSQAFAKALRQLEDGGSFRYSGVVHAAEATTLRPTTVFPEPVAVEGEVDLPGRVHELASDGSDTIHESVIVGPGSWERTNSVEAGPAAAPPYGEGRRGAITMGAALLPEWLRTVTDRVDVDPAEARALGADDGVRLYGGSLALAEVTGELEMFIALDADDVLTRVWIASAEAPFFLDWDIDGIGDQLDIPAPADELVDAAVGIDAADLAAVGIEHPVHLTRLPEGWVLARATIERDAPRGGCSTLHLVYQSVDGPVVPEQESRLDDVQVPFGLDVMPASCAPTEVVGGPFSAGGLTGHAIEGSQNWYGGTTGHLSDGRTAIKFESGLPLADVEVLLGSLAPFDPGVAPTEG